MSGGIYRIQNTGNGRCYIGRTTDFARRRGEHIKHLRGNRHSSPPLQNAWNKYGEAAFTFGPWVICGPQIAEFYEQRLLDRGFGEYNASRSASTPVRFGDRRPRETVEKTAASLRGRKQNRSAEEVARRAARMLGNQFRKGIPHSPEIREKMSAAQRGRRHSPETREKIRAAHLGMRPSLETRVKISAAKLGKRLSLEARAKISAAQIGRRHSPETLAKISAAQIGRRHSPETLAKMRAAKLGKRRSPYRKGRMSVSAARRPRDALGRLKAY